ncbi:hypothetical protein LS73_004335 [Helicobacter muridarum]|nr:hypothetical protein LS73_004335 [Helicobacter muridarum]
MNHSTNSTEIKASSNFRFQSFYLDHKKAAISIDSDVSSFTTDTMQKYGKQEYLDKFYAVWNPSNINTDKENVFYILPSLQNALEYSDQLKKLKKNPPNKNAKNYKKLLKKYNDDISELENKINSLLGVGENLMPNTLEEFSNIIDNMNISEFLKNPKNAIVIEATSIRGVPSNKPRYKNASDFPFDRWQYSLVFEGTPLAITHFSKDGRFAHVQAPYVLGWIDTRNIAFVDKNTQRKILQFEDYKIPNKDFVPVYSKSQWILDARIGQIFPYDKKYKKLITFYKDINNYAQIREVDFNSSLFADFPLPFTHKDMANIINSMIGQKYGWGGLFGNRDCSAFTRDSFATFGVFLPRNSAAQAKFGGGFTDLSNMNNKDKEKYIIEHGIPFGSIIWLRGHIMLYIGYKTIEGKKRAIVAHSAWGVKPIINNKQEDIRLGGVKLTTLYVGSSLTSSETTSNLLISRVQGITNLYTSTNDTATNLERSGIDMSKLQINY